MTKMKTIDEMLKFKSFKDRFNYLKLTGSVGIETFGFNRYLNQTFYTSSEWKRARRSVIMRDTHDGQVCDLGIEGRPIADGDVIIHHLNPITERDILDRNPEILDPNLLVCVSSKTHKALHYGSYDELEEAKDRRPNDTIPWK